LEAGKKMRARFRGLKWKRSDKIRDIGDLILPVSRIQAKWRSKRGPVGREKY